MGRGLCILLLSVMWLNLWAQDHGALRPRGDVNCDWVTDISDVIALTDMVLDGVEYHSLYTYADDINGDQTIDVEDVICLIEGVLKGNLQPMPTYSGTLPVLFINTEGHRDIVSKEEYLRATWWLDNMGDDRFESIGSAQHPQGMSIKGRGNSTWTNMDKKPYRIKFDGAHAVLGMPSSKHWVLLSPAIDWMGQMNDALPFEIGRRMGMAWTPRMEPIEVVLNGQYIGLYYLTEKIRVDRNRVNITEQSDWETNPKRITGGWLLEIDNYGTSESIRFTEGNGQPFCVTSHSPEELSPAQRNYITDFLLKTDSAIYCSDKASRRWEKYIDIDALAVYYIVQESVDNPEAFSGSCYMSKDRGEDTKLIFGPLWDCGSSFYRYSRTYEFNEFIYENVPSYCRTRWIAEIARFQAFQMRVRRHWKRFYEEVYPTMDTYMDSIAARVEAAGNVDYIRWPLYHGNSTTVRLNRYTKRCFHMKVEWLQTQWGGGTDWYIDPESHEAHPRQ